MTSLVADIALHFPSEPVPSAKDAVIDTYMVEHLHRILGGRIWSTLSPLECRHCEDGFTFLTPVGLHYYLPAYITTELVDPDTADCVIDNLIGLFQGSAHYTGEHYDSFWQLLSRDQLDLVLRWLNHYESAYDFNDCTVAEVANARARIALLPKRS